LIFGKEFSIIPNKMNIEYGIQETLPFMIHSTLLRTCLRFTIDCSSVASGISVAQTTVLSGVNPCLIEGDLKKQSQYAGLWPEIRNTKL